MNSFYIPHILGKTIYLTKEESAHCIKVLRLKTGESVQLMDGKGSIYEALIVDPDPKSCLLEITKEEKTQNVRPYHLTIAIAPTKNMDRYEWFLEKATEIGIDRIIPILCRHSERKEVKSDRLNKIVIAAMKQSGQVYLPEITAQSTFEEVIKRGFNGDKLIAHCEPGEKNLLQNVIIPGNNILVLIGPEGDFDRSEINLALGNGFIPVSLGESRLRTETAGVVACHTAVLVNAR
jgi:16S rRNA (uracil1498-N3)-methyltransferase